MEQLLDGKYEVIEKKGEGTGGCVYQVLDRRMNRMVAVKQMPANNEMSFAELEVLKELRHPALPVILDFFSREEELYLVMEYIEGITLQKYMEENGAMRQEQAVDFAIQLGEVLCYLHEGKMPVIHRDIKPANIMLDQGGKIRLIDFGAACFLHTASPSNQMIGTFGYAPPEQMGQEGRADERSDVYSMGITLCQMLTGADPGKPPYCLSPIRCYDKNLSKTLEEIVEKATDKTKERRYQSARQLIHDLSGYQKKDLIRERLRKIAAGIYYFCLLLTGGLFYWFYQKAEMYEPEAGKQGMLICAVILCLLFLLKGMGDRVKRKKSLRRIRNICLTEKKGFGLLAFCLLFILAMIQTNPLEVKARNLEMKKEQLLPVTIREEGGWKVLIRHNAVYEIEEKILFEISGGSFIPGNVYRMKIQCSDIETGELQEKSFYLRLREP